MTRAAGILALIMCCGALSAAPHHNDSPVVLAPGYAELTFTAPPPGSYELPALGPAHDGKIIDSKGASLHLHDLMGDKFTLMSFIYTSCSDVNGCPLATHVFSRVQKRIMADELLADHVRLISFSFDPANDTPPVLEKYAAHFREPGFDWHFVTSQSDKELESILNDYDQFVISDVDHHGKTVGSISHILRVYLIDQDKRIRNIYSVSFLHPDIIVNDIKTIVRNTMSRGSR